MYCIVGNFDPLKTNFCITQIFCDTTLVQPYILHVVISTKKNRKSFSVIASQFTEITKIFYQIVFPDTSGFRTTRV